MSVLKDAAAVTVTGRLRKNVKNDLQNFLTLLDAELQPMAFSYADLIRRAEDWTVHYRSQGLVPGDSIVIILRHGLDVYAAFVGAMLGGFVPAYFAFPSPKHSHEAYAKTIRELLTNAAPKYLVLYEDVELFLKPFTGGLGLRGMTVPERVPLRSEKENIAWHSADPDATAFLQYSSGTTGLKKGVAITHRALLWQVDAYAQTIGLGPQDRIVSWLPLYHDMGLLACFLMPLLKRVPIVAMSAFDWVARPGMLIEAITKYRGTLVWLPNFAYIFLAASLANDRSRILKPGMDLSHWRAVVNCSEPIHAESHRDFLDTLKASGVRFDSKMLASSYAMAENTFAVTSGGFDKPLQEETIDGRRLVSSGTPLPQTQIRIVGLDGAALPERQWGEITVKSPCLLKEYHRNPSATAESLKDGWLHTGDMGCMVGNELYVTGRKKDMLIISGQNIYPQDIEALVHAVPGVYPGRVIALGIPNVFGSESLIVVAEPQNPADENSERLAVEIQKKIAQSTEVSASDVRIVEHGWLIKSTSGKIARAANREKYLNHFLKKPELPQVENTNTLSRVRSCVERVISDRGLKSSDVGNSDELFKQGWIDSLGLASLIAELEKNFSVRLPVDFFADSARDSIDSIANAMKEMSSKSVENRESSGACFEMEAPKLNFEEVEYKKVKIRRSSAFLWTWFYRILFKCMGVHYGKGLTVHGFLILRLEGKPSNLIIGNNVTFMPLVDIKNRENGKIILHDNVFLDTCARLVVANDATIALGQGVQVGIGSVINAGADVTIGRASAIAGHCTIIASEHTTYLNEPVMKQGYHHEPVVIGEDVWLAAYVLVTKGSRIANGAVISGKSFVSGNIPANAIATGIPAKVVRFRQPREKGPL